MLPPGTSRHMKVSSKCTAFVEGLLKSIMTPGFSRKIKEKDIEEWLRNKFYHHTFEFMCEADKRE